LGRGAKNVVITLGEKGAYYANTKESGHIHAYKVNVVDTTGAGDTFTGAYATEYLKRKAAGTWNIHEAILRANKACALTIQRVGCQDGIPWSDEVDAFQADFNEKALAGNSSTAAGGLTVPMEPDMQLPEVEMIKAPEPTGVGEAEKVDIIHHNATLN